MELIFFIVLGGFVGFLAGLLGIGGGTMVVPAIAFWLDYSGFHCDRVMHVALGSSLATICFTSLSSIWAHQRHGNIKWNIVSQLIVGLVLGVVFGSWLGYLFDSKWLAVIFSCFLISNAVYMLNSFELTKHYNQPGLFGMVMVAFTVGALSALLGLGGGIFFVSLFAFWRWPMRDAVGTSAACGFPVALVGMVSYMLLGIGPIQSNELDGLNSLTGLVGFVYWPAVVSISIASVIFAPIGAHFASRVSNKALRRAFAVLMLVIAAGMLFQLSTLA